MAINKIDLLLDTLSDPEIRATFVANEGFLSQEEMDIILAALRAQLDRANAKKAANGSY